MRAFLRKNMLMMVFLLTVLIISACSNNNQDTTAEPEDEEETPATENNNDTEQVITLNTGSEPATLDPPLIDNRPAGDIANQLFEGLVRIDENGNPAPGVAKEWEISDDGLVYTFYLNDKAKWSNGDPVTAEDFFYSWERTLRPDMAAPLGSNLFFIKNGAQYNSGEITDPAQLGMKVINDTTFEVTLERPTSFFLGLTAFKTLLPVNKEVVESNPEWDKEAETFVSNGPFKLESWSHGQEIVMVPNENYWARDLVKLDEIRWLMVNDQNTEYGMYQSGELDVSNSFPNSIKGELVASGEAKSSPASSMMYLRYNNEDDLFSNANIRRALSYALNRQLIVERVTQGGEVPALAFIPPGLSSGAGEFRSLAGEALFEDNDVETAKQMLEQGLEELGLSSFPETTLLFATDDTNNKLAQAMQEMWKQGLGIDISLQTMESKVFVDTVKSGDYDFALYGTGADYDDAINLLEQYLTEASFNYSNISLPEFDELIQKAYEEVDLETRAQYMVDAEKVLIDEMAIAPLYYSTRVYLQNDNLKGVLRFSIQPTDFREAYLE